MTIMKSIHYDKRPASLWVGLSAKALALSIIFNSIAAEAVPQTTGPKVFQEKIKEMAQESKSESSPKKPLRKPEKERQD